MKTKRFKPLFDKLFFIIFIPITVLMIAFTVLECFAPMALFIIIPIDTLVLYLLLSPLFGYVELRESSLFIKYGLVLKKRYLTIK